MNLPKPAAARSTASGMHDSWYARTSRGGPRRLSPRRSAAERVMGINVQTESERGEKIGEVVDSHDYTKALLPSYSDSSWACLR